MPLIMTRTVPRENRASDQFLVEGRHRVRKCPRSRDAFISTGCAYPRGRRYRRPYFRLARFGLKAF